LAKIYQVGFYKKVSTYALLKTNNKEVRESRKKKKWLPE